MNTRQDFCAYTADKWRTCTCQNYCIYTDSTLLYFVVTFCVAHLFTVSYMLHSHKCKVLKHFFFCAQKISSSIICVYTIQLFLKWEQLTFYANVLVSSYADHMFSNCSTG